MSSSAGPSAARISAWMALIAQLACCAGGAGGSAGGSAGDSALPSEPATPTLNIAIAPATVATGRRATLSWSSTNASACTASGAWSGLQDASGSVHVSQSDPGDYVYTLGCSNAAGSASQTVTLMVTRAASLP